MNTFENKLSGISIDKRSGTPVWMQVYKGMKSILAESNLLPGTKLPSLRRSGELLSISYLTVSKAIGRLVDDGSVEVREGSGIYIQERKGQSLHAVGVLMYEGKYSSMIAEMFHGISRELSSAGINMIVHSDQRMDPSQRFIRRIIKERQSVGFIVYGDELFKGRLFIEEILPAVPIVVLNRCEVLPVDGMVYSDDEQGMDELVKAIHAKGHQRVLYFSSSSSSICTMRRTAFEQAAQVCGIEYEIVNGVDNDEIGYLQAMRVVVEKKKFTAIACWNDSIALGVIRLLHAQGVNIPGDIAVTGYGNLDFADKVHPRLSTVEQYYEEMGMESVRLLLQSAQKRSYENPVRIKTRTSFVHRDSL